MKQEKLPHGLIHQCDHKLQQEQKCRKSLLLLLFEIAGTLYSLLPLSLIALALGSSLNITALLVLLRVLLRRGRWWNCLALSNLCLFLFLFRIVVALYNSAITMRRCDLWSHKKSRSAKGTRFFSLQVHRSKSRHLHALISNKFLCPESRNSWTFLLLYHCF